MNRSNFISILSKEEYENRIFEALDELKVLRNLGFTIDEHQLRIVSKDFEVDYEDLVYIYEKLHNLISDMIKWTD